MISNGVFEFLLKIIGLLFVGSIAFIILTKNKTIIETFYKIQEGIGAAYYNVFGKRVSRLHTKVSRKALLNKDSRFYKIYKFYDNIIVNLDLKKNHVTVTGFLTFMIVISVGVALIVANVLTSYEIIPVLTAVVFYLLTTAFRLISLTRYEKREAEIMDAVDLLVSDIKGGVENAIQKYIDSFHPNIRPYFVIFLDDMSHKGYGFEDAIVKLNESLGPNFTEFTHKAILYEKKADKDLEDIFSTIIETNRETRQLRYLNDIQFTQIRRDFILSLGLIIGYIIFTVVSDTFIINFLTTSFIGKMLVVLDVFIVGWVMSYLAKIKAENL